MWIDRDISNLITSNLDPIQILRGPRQCGKTSLLLHIGKDFKELSLDDPSLRDLAKRDPELFLNQFGLQKLLIDEAQYAPELFPSLKRRVDLFKRTNAQTHTIFRLTGSNQILMDRNVKESLAGRASFFDINTLCVAEILSSQNTAIQEILFKGGWPELHANPNKNPKKFLDDYINSYIERDIVLSAGIQKSREFLRFVQLLSGRVGTLLDLSYLSRESSVDIKTIKDWISILERMHIIVLVEPFSSNLTSRLIKSPKVYFLDTGLACRLQGWSSSQPITVSPMHGALFENLVFCEIFKTNQNAQLGWSIFHWRSRDGEEVDFLIQKDPDHFVFIEAKVSPVKVNHIKTLPEVKKVFKNIQPKFFVVHQEGTHILNDHVPIALLKQTLLQDVT